MATVISRQPRGERRRAQVIDGAIKVIAERGLEAVSHRLVAAAAGVPLATTGYYFRSLDDLRAAALRETLRREMVTVERRFEQVTSPAEAAEVIADMLYVDLQRGDPANMLLDMFASATRRDSVREIVAEWTGAWMAYLDPLVGRLGTVATMTAATGLIQFALTKEPLSREEILAVIDRAMGLPARP